MTDKNMFYGANKNTFAKAGELRQNMTSAEKAVWTYLRTKPLGCKFRRQHAISKYIVDFYCHSLNLVIEIDGGIHNLKEVNEHDQVRQEYLESQGLIFIRFKNQDIETNFDKVIETIENYIRKTQ